jgi:hypothetical protein
MEKNNITIFLNEEEAKRWLVFQKNYDLFMLLVERGVFDIRNGSATLNFNPTGQITTIQRVDMLYNARVEKNL